MHAETKDSSRSLIALTAAFVVASFVFVAINVFTQHAPKAHDLRVAYVGSPVAQIFIQSGLNKAVPGAFELRAYPDEKTAREAILRREVYGAFVLREESALVLTASAAGTSARQAIDRAFEMMMLTAPESMRVELISEDLKPLPEGDSRGLSSSALQFGLLVCSFVFGILLFISAQRERLARLLLAVALYSVASALVAALTVGPLLGALSGHFWAITLVGAIFSAGIVLVTYGLELVFGLAGTGISALVLILVGHSAAGGASNQEFLPGFFRQIGQALPNGAFVRFLRNSVYFDGNHTCAALAVIAVWAAAGLALVLLASPVRAALRRHSGRSG